MSPKWIGAKIEAAPEIIMMAGTFYTLVLLTTKENRESVQSCMYKQLNKRQNLVIDTSSPAVNHPSSSAYVIIPSMEIKLPRHLCIFTTLTYIAHLFDQFTSYDWHLCG